MNQQGDPERKPQEGTDQNSCQSSNEGNPNNNVSGIGLGDPSNPPQNDDIGSQGGELTNGIGEDVAKPSENSEAIASSNAASASVETQAQSTDQESANCDATNDKESTDTLLNKGDNEAKGPPAALASDNASPNSEKADHSEQTSDGMAVAAADEVMQSQNDMEMGSTVPPNSDVEAQNPGVNGTKPTTGMDRRTSKRQRAGSTSRFEPGEGGGLASKKPKTNNGTDTSGPGEDGGLNPIPESLGATTSDPTEGVGGNGVKDASEKTKNGGNDTAGWSEPSYRWIDAGVQSDISPSSVEHDSLEIDFTKSKTANWTPPPPFTVRPGDVVLISSGDAPWDDAKQQNTDDSNKAKRDVVPIYNDPASNEAGLGALDPYIGYVERLWEEADDSNNKGGWQKKKKGKSPKTTVKPSRMMIRTRWFFKKEELVGLKGNFVVEGGTSTGGITKQEVLSSMASQDLVLTDQSDDNAVSAILGKVTVVKRKPLDKSDDVDMTVPKGGHVCRYDLSFVPQTDDREGIVQLVPYAGNSNFNARIGRSETKDIGMPEPMSTDEDGYASTKQGNYERPQTPMPFPMSPSRRVISEGVATVGKIKVGPNHQAVIPEQIDLGRKASSRGLVNPPSQRIPTMVWDPACDDGDAVDGFLEEATTLLINHMKDIGLESFHDANYVECPNVNSEAKKPREVNVDCLLLELHECRGDAQKAIKKIASTPETFMTIWDKEDKEKFDTGYRVYRESVRMISNSMGDKRSCKDTVDYQYRFKLVENFRRFKMKKRVKAEEIMSTVEDRMLNEKVKEDAKTQDANETDTSSSSEDGRKMSPMPDGQVGSALTAVPSTHSGPVNNRVRTWFRTAGGNENVVGAMQHRRNQCSDVLTQVRDKVGKDAYMTLVKSLKICNSSQATDGSLTEVKTTANEVMKSHPDLLQQFMSFLPREVRSN